jgi:hypothetical protein
MAYEVAFAEISDPPGERPAAPKHFRIALMGDFSGRVNRGDQTPIGERKPIKVDYDGLEDVLETMDITLRIPIAGGAGQVEVSIGEMDDFHPDQLFDKLEIIDELQGLARRVDRKPDVAIPLLVGWGRDARELATPPAFEGGGVIPAASSLQELADWSPSAAVDEDQATADGDALLSLLVGPYMRELGDDPDADAVREAVQKASDGLLREIMHHPDFRAVESAWRGLDWLLRRTARGDRTRVVLFDVGAVELAADLAAVTELDNCGCFELLVRKTAESVDGEAWCAVLGLYTFDLQGTHADLLGRMARIAHRLHAPFISGFSHRLLEEGARPDEDSAAAWDELRALPESGYIALAAPGFLLRRPYGEDADEIDEFPFEELRAGDDLGSYLWGSPALLVAALLAQDFLSAGGWNFKPGKTLRMGDMTMHSYRDEDDEGVAVIVGKRALSSVAEKYTARGPMLLVQERGTDVAQLGALYSLNAADRSLLGLWGAEGGSAVPMFTLAAAAAVGVNAVAGSAGGDAGGAVDEDDADEDADGADVADAGDDDDLDSLLGDLDDDSGGDDDDLDDLLGGLDDDSGGDDDDLDSLLAGLDDDSSGDDSDLDSLLSSLDDDSDDADDSDLDALLSDLDGDDDGDDVDLDSLLAGLGDDDDDDIDLDDLLKD